MMLKWDHEVLFVFGQNEQGQARYERFMTRIGNGLVDNSISNLDWIHPVPDSIDNDETREEWVEDNLGFVESSVTNVLLMLAFSNSSCSFNLMAMLWRCLSFLLIGITRVLRLSQLRITEIVMRPLC